MKPIKVVVFVLFFSCEVPINYNLENISGNEIVIQAIILSDEIPLIRINSPTFPESSRIDSVLIKDPYRTYNFYLDTIIQVMNSGERNYLKSDMDYQLFTAIHMNFFDHYYQMIYRNDSLKFLEEHQYELCIIQDGIKRIKARAIMPLSYSANNLQLINNSTVSMTNKIKKGISYLRPKLYASFNLLSIPHEGHYRGYEISTEANQIIKYEFEKDTVINLNFKYGSYYSDYYGEPDSLFLYLESFEHSFVIFDEILASRNRSFSIFEMVYDNTLLEYQNVNSFNNAFGIFTLINRKIIRKKNL